MDEERREVLAILESSTTGGRTRGSTGSIGGPARTGSPFRSPRSPVRSMLDVDPPAPRNRSLPGPAVGISSLPIRSMLDIASAPPPAVRSMLDISTPLPPAAISPRVQFAVPYAANSSSKSSTTTTSPRIGSPGTQSAQASPTETGQRAVSANQQHRSSSDVAARPPDSGSRAPGFEAPSPYQFSGYLQSNPGGPVVPKRNTQGGKKPQIPSAMAEVVRGGDLSTFGTRDGGRHSIAAGSGIGSHVEKSKSPSNRFGLRSNSPRANMAQTDASKVTLDNGTEIDMSSAYRRLSDANLARSIAGMESLNERNRRRRTNSGDADAAGSVAGQRLEKDYNDEDAFEPSSDDEGISDDENIRGRQKEKSRDDDNYHPESQTLGMGRAKGPRTAKSLMAAVEDERRF